MAVVRALVFLVGVGVAARTALAAIRTFVVPRAIAVTSSRAVFLAVRWVFLHLPPRRTDYESLDRRFALYAPACLLSLMGVWLTLEIVAFTAIYWGLGEDLWHATAVSGSSLFTLGFDHPEGRPATVISFLQAGLGIGLLALLITYLPTIYGAFQRREQLVSLLEVRAGSPPSAVTMLERYHRIGLTERSDELWETAEAWFADVAESHTSLASLPFFRSPQPDQHWLAAAGALLDGASLSMAALDVPPQPNAALLVRSGYVALRRIADFFDIPYDPDPKPDDPISISRAEFEEALDRLAAEGAPIVADRDQAWRDFSGWRVNYDTVLRTLSGLMLTPDAPWTTDRPILGHRPPLRRRRRDRRTNG